MDHGWSMQQRTQLPQSSLPADIPLDQRVAAVRRRIHDAAARAKRDPQSITLLAVSKTVSIARIREAAACGIHHAGENRLQDAIIKMDALRDLDLTWHFIGRIQTNKAKKIAEAFHSIHSVDRLEVVEKLGRAAMRPIAAFIEVKLHHEPEKSGALPAELPELIAAIREQRQLNLRGLMAVPPFLNNLEDVRPYFRQLRELSEKYGLPELSMGMTHDFEVAIEEGATIVRVGTGLFGPRQ
jgi:hypothetical protein